MCEVFLVTRMGIDSDFAQKKFACVQLFESMADEVPPEQLVVLISLTSIAKET